MKDDTLRFKNVKNYCDFICFSYPNLYLLELKSTKQRSLPFNNISQYQIDSLYDYSKQEGIIAGFVINFHSYNYQTFFLPAVKAYDYYHQAERKSFPLEWKGKWNCVTCEIDPNSLSLRPKPHLFTLNLIHCSDISP